MDPAIYHGDLVMIDQRKTHIRSGKIYAFIDSDALRIKRIVVIPETALILRSDNPKHAPDHRVGEAMNHVSQNILGRVVWSGHSWGSETERTIMRNLFLGLPVLFVCSMANAQNFESMQRATELGTVIAAEDLCGLTFDQSAVSDWIDENTDPSDMSFPGTLQMMVDGSTFQNSGMSGSALTAHCRSVERTARHFGFIE